MTVVALAVVAVLAATVWSFTTVLRSQQHAHARREDLLLNQLLHAVGKTWTPPPADTWPAPQPGEPLVHDLGWTATPEQQPLYPN